MNRAILLLLAHASAQSTGNGVAKSTYSCNDPISMHKWMKKYFPVQTSEDECTHDVCVCPATSSESKWNIQQGRVYFPVNQGRALLSKRGRNLQGAGNGYGIHCVNVSAHLTTGGMSNAEVEAQFNIKLGEMKEYDSFMDFSTTFYTASISKYAAAFDADNVSYFATTWQSNSKNATSYTSLIVQVPDTQVVIELTSKESLQLGQTKRPIHALVPGEQRASSRALSLVEELESSGKLSGKLEGEAATFVPLSVNRAVSADVLAKLDDFYVTGMGTTKVSEDSRNGDYTRKCYLWPGAEVDVCFVNRDTSATKGDWKVADFENMLNTVHTNLIVGHPFCGVDKWEDNHYAIDSRTANTSKIISYINGNSVPHICQGNGVHYIIDPTGWAIQSDLSWSSGNTLTTDCLYSLSSTQSSRDTDSSNPACNLGQCGGTVQKPIVV